MSYPWVENSRLELPAFGGKGQHCGLVGTQLTHTSSSVVAGTRNLQHCPAHHVQYFLLKVLSSRAGNTSVAQDSSRLLHTTGREGCSRCENKIEGRGGAQKGGMDDDVNRCRQRPLINSEVMYT